MPRAGFEPAIPETKRPQTYTLDRGATKIGGMRTVSTKFCSLPDIAYSNSRRQYILPWGLFNVTRSRRCLRIKPVAGDHVAVCMTHQPAVDRRLQKGSVKRNGNGVPGADLSEQDQRVARSSLVPRVVSQPKFVPCVEPRRPYRHHEMASRSAHEGSHNVHSTHVWPAVSRHAARPRS
jgi:hypothetical protein